MALKNILVHMDNTPTALSRLQCAIAMAQDHSAKLVGLVGYASHFYQVDLPGKSLVQMEAEFIARTSEAKVSAEWRSVDLSNTRMSLAHIVSYHAYFSDLVIVGKELNSFGSPDIRSEQPIGLIVSSGRPVLVVPSIGDFKSVGKNVLVAWRVGREATRAVHDAMPLLEKANVVEVVTAKHQESDLDGSDLLRSFLHEHGIDTKVETILTTEIPLGDILLNRAGDKGFDLLVLGAFSRTHFGSLVLGEVGTHLLQYANIPVLMSH